jgi:hypothetical protein
MGLEFSGSRIQSQKGIGYRIPKSQHWEWQKFSLSTVQCTQSCTVPLSAIDLTPFKWKWFVLVCYEKKAFTNPVQFVPTINLQLCFGFILHCTPKREVRILFDLTFNACEQTGVACWGSLPSPLPPPRPTSRPEANKLNEPWGRFCDSIIVGIIGAG